MLKIVVSIVVTLFLIIPQIAMSSIMEDMEDRHEGEEVSITYTFQKPMIGTVDIAETVYDRVVLPDCSPAGKPGEPMVPSKGAYILLPPKSKVDMIHINPSEKIVLGMGFMLEPTSIPIPLSQTTSLPVPTPDATIYSDNAFYPGNLYTEVGTYSFRGYHLLVLQLHPIQYNPVTGELFYYRNLEVSIETTDDDVPQDLFRNLEKDRNEVAKKVDNPEISEWYYQTAQPLSIDEVYDLLIITTDSLKDGFEPLKQAHDATNIDTVIKTLSDIGSIDLEDIRDYIKDAYMEWGIDYVLIGGDDDVVPDPWLWVSGMDENTTPYTTYMPSDIYYACLDGPYNYDGDNKWGEPTDGENGGDVDLMAEVYVGRACVGNATEVNNFVTKTLAYINKDPEDEYLTKVYLAGERLGNFGIASWGGNYLDQLINESSDDNYTTVGISAIEYNITTLYDRDWPGNEWPKAEIIDRINNGVHIINHHGHGNTNYAMKMSSLDIDVLVNDKYCFVYSQTCSAGHFDDEDCFAEHLNVKTPYGAFAVIMNARYGFFWAYSTDGDSQRFNREFWDAVFGENIMEIGKANQDSKEDNLHIIGRSCIRFVYYGLNLFGDPSLTLVNNPPGTPEQLDGPTQGYTNEEYIFSASTSDPEGDQVFYMWNWSDETYSDWLGPYDSGATMYVNHIWNETGDYNITVKAKDVYDFESDWSEPKIIHIHGVPVLEIGNISGGLFKVTAEIKNNGSADVVGVDWGITLDGGFILLGKETTGRIMSIPAGEEVTVRSDLICGLGRTVITAMAEKPGVSSDTKEQDAFVFLFFIL